MAAASSDGGPTGGRGPPTVLEFSVINFSVCFVLPGGGGWLRYASEGTRRPSYRGVHWSRAPASTDYTSY